MAKIISNEKLDDDIYIMKVEGKFEGEMGQFYMLRAWNEYPVLSRPISIHDIDDNSISFLYRVVGEGTEMLSNLKENDDIELQGPNGNGYPEVEGNVALIGGGMGIAPLFLAAKSLKKMKNVKNIDIYLGFSQKAILTEKFKKYADNLVINVGGIIIDELDAEKYDYILTCGPEIMMKKMVQKSKDTQAKVYVSMEKRMACGVGACLVCTCKTSKGNKKTCKDGPVFLGEDVFYE